MARAAGGSSESSHWVRTRDGPYRGAMPGTLYVCSTPIGNLGDISERLKATLARVDVVFAEDTRRTGKLLSVIGVSVPLRSYFVGNEADRAEELAERLAAGEDVALVSDAGTPSVADPGLSAVRVALSVGAVVTPIPGPSAVTAALAVADVPTERFVFEGFLPRKGGDRTARMGDLATERRTTVFFTTGNRIGKDLTDLASRCSPSRRVVVGRELTKLHEEIWRGTLAESVEHWKDGRGEFTVVLEGAAPESTVSIEEATVVVLGRIEQGVSMKDAVREVAESLGLRKRELYAAVLAERSTG